MICRLSPSIRTPPNNMTGTSLEPILGALSAHSPATIAVTDGTIELAFQDQGDILDAATGIIGDAQVAVDPIDRHVEPLRWLAAYIVQLDH